MTMIQLFLTGFGLGLAGSLHCVGMCGPLALALPVQQATVAGRITAYTAYNAGRVVTYMLLGTLAGLISTAFSLAGWQQVFSILSGLLLLGLSLLYLFKKKLLRRNIFPGLQSFMQRQLVRLAHTQKVSTYALLGMANGLLPCGMLYVALASALVTGDGLHGSLFMAGFGLATLPAMLLLLVAGSFISFRTRAGFQKVAPYLVLLVSLLLVARGMGLGIAWLSPALEPATGNKAAAACHP